MIGRNYVTNFWPNLLDTLLGMDKIELENLKGPL